MIKPVQQDEQLLHDILRSVNHLDGFRVWWLGQSGFLLQWQGKHLLFDPYLSDSLTHKYAHTDKPHTRLSKRVIAPALLPPIDIVTSSHNHTDHLDADTLLPILAKNPAIQLIIPEANRQFVSERLGCELDFPIGMNDQEPIGAQEFTFYGIPAAHNELERDANGYLKFMGYVVKFGDFSVYHSGDTLWYDDIVEHLLPHQIDIAFLPINGNKPERRVAGNLNAEEAARLGKAIKAKLVIPHHYDLFAFNTEDPQRFVEQAFYYQTPHRVLQLGEGISYPLL
ncbi:MAG: MBL fold metallo-hydrolase [Spirosomataceae bacterium]